jgi:FlaA1/EpsC-like NDP-sugar epimerase
MATELIRLSGFRPNRDIKITFSGMRPGEKLYEELFLAGEDYQRTSHTKIFMARSETPMEARLLEQVVFEVIKLAQEAQKPEESEQLKTLIHQICRHVDNYKPQPHSENYSQPVSSKPTSTMPADSTGTLYPHSSTSASY